MKQEYIIKEKQHAQNQKYKMAIIRPRILLRILTALATLVIYF